MDDQPINENNAKRTLANPFYAITVSKLFTDEHEPSMSEEDWVKQNSKLIDEIGAEEWLHRLLEVLKNG
ncbi:MAG TPA: hypothetical protein VIH90_04625 [Candidatus Saccharimonadales bacterium]